MFGSPALSVFFVIIFVLFSNKWYSRRVIYRFHCFNIINSQNEMLEPKYELFYWNHSYRGHTIFINVTDLFQCTTTILTSFRQNWWRSNRIHYYCWLSDIQLFPYSLAVRGTAKIRNKISQFGPFIDRSRPANIEWQWMQPYFSWKEYLNNGMLNEPCNLRQVNSIFQCGKINLRASSIEHIRNSIYSNCKRWLAWYRKRSLWHGN